MTPRERLKRIKEKGSKKKSSYDKDALKRVSESGGFKGKGYSLSDISDGIKGIFKGMTLDEKLKKANKRNKDPDYKVNDKYNPNSKEKTCKKCKGKGKSCSCD